LGRSDPLGRSDHRTVQACLPLFRPKALVTIRYFGVQLLAVGE